MPAINIGGQTVNVDDSFTSLSPDQQNATVDHIAGQLGINAAPAQPSFGSDDYIKNLASKYGSTPDYVRGLAESETGGAGLRGIPLLGGLVNKAGAGLASLTGNVPSYSKGLELENELERGYESAHPIESTAAGVIGGVATTAPLGATSLGMRLLGLTGGLPSMVVRGGLTSGAIGAADAAIRGEDPGTAALEAGLTGAAFPLAGRAVGGLYRGARNAMAGANVARGANFADLDAAAVNPNVADARVPLSGGQISGDQQAQMFEQGALRGGFGVGPQRVAQGFFEGEQAPAMEEARQTVGRAMDPFGMPIAESPTEAGDLVAQAVRTAAARSRGNYESLYNTALSAPGEFHVGAFEGLGQKIKGDLSLAQKPVVVDDVTTPVASRMIQQIDNNIGRPGGPSIQNRADPFGQPNPQNIVGVNLAGVDQARKQLVEMASATQYGSADQRAARRIISSFDDRIESAISDGLFSGDDGVLDQIKAARAAYREHVQTFQSQKGDWGVGLAMEKIIGRNGNEGATPEQVANYLYGQAKVGGSDLSQHLAERIQDVLGDRSPEWAAVRQGLWSRLTTPTEGVTNRMGPQLVANRINEFLNGSGRTTANIMYSPQEQALMRRYADILNQTVPKPGAVNYSNTGPVLAMIGKQTLNMIFAALGDYAAGPIGIVAGLGIRGAQAALSDRSTMGQVARSIYNSPAANRQAQVFANQMARYVAMGQRALIGPTNQLQQGSPTVQ